MITKPRQQRTIARPTQVTGFGYWTGRDVRVEFRPASINTGYVFVRRDLSPVRRIRVRHENRIETPRRTTLTENGGTVEMVEHVLAALAGLQIDNCEIWVDAAEMPGADGSSLAVVEALSAADIVEQDALRRVLTISQTVHVGDEECWIQAGPSRQPGVTIEYHLDYGDYQPIGRQVLRGCLTPDFFRTELAAARTFVLESEAKWMKARGLGTRTTYRDLLVFNGTGPIGNRLRFPDECVRHKVLDLVGDLALAGCDFHGTLVAHRSGHQLNAELVRTLLTRAPGFYDWRHSA